MSAMHMNNAKQKQTYLLGEDAHDLLHEHLLHDDSLHVAEDDMMDESQRHHVLYGHDNECCPTQSSRNRRGVAAFR